MFLLITIIFAISFLRTSVNTEYVRVHLQGKSSIYGHVGASLFGIVTPFCSCSAIPLFLGFIQARIPIKVTSIYIVFGLSVAIFGGWLIGKLNLEKEILMDVRAPSS